MIQRLTCVVDADATTYLLSLENGAVEAILRVDADGYIMSLFVEESARGRGVGKALIEEACQLMRENGKKTVGLSVHHENHGARRLYERLGFLPYVPGHEGYTQFIKVL